jgi:putative intracellular protease/amidase
MLKKRSIFKKLLFTVISLIVLLVAFAFWFVSLLPTSSGKQGIKITQPQDLVYLSQGIKESRGKILAVVTSTDVMGSSKKKTGYELTELSRAYYVFKANGFEVDIASPKGGEPPVVVDDDDMGKFDYAFLNDELAQSKVSNSMALSDVDADDYKAVYFVGGKGAMFDFPQNAKIQSIISDYYQSGKVVGAVCHGPAALVNVTLDDGTPLLANKSVTSFTNEEELLLIPNAKKIFPFLLQTKLEEQGAKFDNGPVYLEQVVIDGQLVTGQNPWSVWKLAEAMIQQLGYQPVARKITAEENTISILSTFDSQGYNQAKAQIKSMQSSQKDSVDRVLLAVHSAVSIMEMDVVKFYNLVSLLAVAEND